jgi:hypothetical protein
MSISARSAQPMRKNSRSIRQHLRAAGDRIVSAGEGGFATSREDSQRRNRYRNSVSPAWIRELQSKGDAWRRAANQDSAQAKLSSMLILLTRPLREHYSVGLRKSRYRRKSVSLGVPRSDDPVGGRNMRVLCSRCRVGWIERDRCPRCGNKLSRAEEDQERFVRVLRNGLICLVSVLAGLFLAVRIL